MWRHIFASKVVRRKTPVARDRLTRKYVVKMMVQIIRNMQIAIKLQFLKEPSKFYLKKNMFVILVFLVSNYVKKLYSAVRRCLFCSIVLKRKVLHMFVIRWMINYLRIVIILEYYSIQTVLLPFSITCYIEYINEFYRWCLRETSQR